MLAPDASVRKAENQDFLPSVELINQNSNIKLLFFKTKEEMEACVKEYFEAKEEFEKEQNKMI